MFRMNIRPRVAGSVAALFFVAMPVSAQDVYDSAITDHAEAHMNNVILRKNLKHARDRQNGLRIAPGSNARKAQACAGRERFRREYGADNPKVRQLYALCARDGY